MLLEHCIFDLSKEIKHDFHLDSELKKLLIINLNFANVIIY